MPNMGVVYHVCLDTILRHRSPLELAKDAVKVFNTVKEKGLLVYHAHGYEFRLMKEIPSMTI